MEKISEDEWGRKKRKGEVKKGRMEKIGEEGGVEGEGKSTGGSWRR